ncbi:hypothetical protein AJ80_01181 [Polytolypa hystricis UAMH7299]|uniref:Uncharacterized protein n=1 Tax=Polytolypa hystricis (strain UAMH7299) TaxID=1447883 RepID=A0A2B7YT58_POLH7|nr:hypothetical protein AJ80_01181 [Polytolypa hystricis UAMH7299]
MSRYRDGSAFGELPFDHFIAAEWDPSSTLSKHGQKRALVEKWIRLGRYGRNEYFERFDDVFPPHAPHDLLSDADRDVDGHISRTLWIRTWFGHKADKASQEAADAAYKKLFIRAMLDDDENGRNDCMDPEFIYDKPEEFGIGTTGDNPADIADGIALGTPRSVPSYLVNALMHCPDQFDGDGDRDWRHQTLSEAEAEELEKHQSLLVIVADRKACEEGWVLHLAINHRGEILPLRIRDKASLVFQSVANWLDGQTLTENTLNTDEDKELYMREGNGWDWD